MRSGVSFFTRLSRTQSSEKWQLVSLFTKSSFLFAM